MESMVFTTQEVADLLGISRSYAYEMIRQGVIPSMSLGEHKRLVPKEMFFRWLSEKSGVKKELEKASFLMQGEESDEQEE